MPFSESTEPSAELRTAEFMLRPIVAGDAEADYAAVMDTRADLRLWRQSTWPEDDFTVAANRDDVVELEQRHVEHRAFTYTVLDPDGHTCTGCVYVFPTSATFLANAAVTALGDAEWADVDAAVFFWVRRPQREHAMDGRLLAALRTWFTQEWRFDRTVFVTSEQFTQQVQLLEATDLRLKFRLLEPGQSSYRLVYG